MSIHSVIICMLHRKKPFVPADSHRQMIYSKLDLSVEEKGHRQRFHEIICLNLDVIFTPSLEQEKDEDRLLYVLLIPCIHWVR